MKLKDIEKLCENAIGPGLFGLVNVHVGVLQKLVAVAKAAKTLGIDLVNRGAYDTIANSPENKLSDALAALEAE